MIAANLIFKTNSSARILHRYSLESRVIRACSESHQLLALCVMSTGSTEYIETEPNASANVSSTSSIMRFIDTSSGYLTSMIFVRVLRASVLTFRK